VEIDTIYDGWLDEYEVDANAFPKVALSIVQVEKARNAFQFDLRSLSSYFHCVQLPPPTIRKISSFSKEFGGQDGRTEIKRYFQV
jgi:hypothetical protein